MLSYCTESLIINRKSIKRPTQINISVFLLVHQCARAMIYLWIVATLIITLPLLKLLALNHFLLLVLNPQFHPCQVWQVLYQFLVCLYYRFRIISLRYVIYLANDGTIAPQVSVDDPSPPCREEANKWTGFKIVGDNLDKTVRPRYMRLDRQTESLHYFHSFAVKNRVDFRSLSDIPPNQCQHPNRDLLAKLLPSTNDIQTMHSLFGVHITRILVEHLPFMKPFADVVSWHIPHEFSSEMAQKSEVVSAFSKAEINSKCYISTLLHYRFH